MITFRISSNKYQLNFYGKEMLLSFCELLAFRNRINAIDINDHFYGDHNGIEIIPICNFKEVLILETTDILEFKRIINAIFTPQEFEASY